jgi:hypothetical protein
MKEKKHEKIVKGLAYEEDLWYNKDACHMTVPSSEIHESCHAFGTAQ